MKTLVTLTVNKLSDTLKNPGDSSEIFRTDPLPERGATKTGFRKEVRVTRPGDVQPNSRLSDHA